MFSRFRSFKRLFFELPKQIRLAYCLMRDARVPMGVKAAFGGGMAVVLSPWFNLPEMIPVVGEIDVLAVTALAVKLFIAACPDEVIVDIEQQIIEQTSVFDDDVRSGERIALAIARRFQHEPVQDVVGTSARDLSATQAAQQGDNQ